ncbi:MAG: hypothetical protein IKV35_00685, partial [Clostridia bacterium]|nr:hypothetical protein [Clostridia bacterium]
MAKSGKKNSKKVRRKTGAKQRAVNARQAKAKRKVKATAKPIIPVETIEAVQKTPTVVPEPKAPTPTPPPAPKIKT